MNIILLPFEYWLCLFWLVAATAYASMQIREPWAPPFMAVLATVVGWYMTEPLLFDDYIDRFPEDIVSGAFRCVLIFLVALTVATPFAVKALRPSAAPDTPLLPPVSPEQLVKPVVGVWLCLVVYGTLRMEGDIVGALFPLESRAGGRMWSRAAADAGATGFIVSTAAYLYTLSLAAFGILIAIARDRKTRLLLLCCILVSWPYAFLQGSRNITLFVVVPGVAAYLFLGKATLARKVTFGVAAFFVLEFAMRAIIALRNEGFREIATVDVDGAMHLGLNMASELTFIIGFLDAGVLAPSYGWGYLSEVLNVVPRVLWPDKPRLGIDYALARGFGGAANDIGVFATISSGVVGQGVLNFGTFLGPVAAGGLIAMWIAFLARLRVQGGAARDALFLVGLGLTFNLGRDITLLVLFPFVFGYLCVRVFEAYLKKRERPRRFAAGRPL